MMLKLSLQEFAQRFLGNHQSVVGNFYSHAEYDTGEVVESTGDAKSLIDALNESGEEGRGGSACTQVGANIIDITRYTDEGELPVCQVDVYSVEPREEIASLPGGDDMPLLQDMISTLKSMGISVEQHWRGDTFSESSSYYY